MTIERNTIHLGDFMDSGIAKERLHEVQMRMTI